MRKMKRHHSLILLVPLLVLSILLSACGQEKQTTAKTQEVHIGYQKNGTTLTVKNNQELQKELEKEGYKVTWSEFNTGSSILEALNAGSIDFAGAGDIPSIFALSKGSDFKYIASAPSSPTSQGILVSKDSQIKSLKDLKGKKIAFNKASIAQYLLTRSLASVGLSENDVIPVYLNPPDASVAFEQGKVDAWVVWDPYLTVAESKGNVILDTPNVPYRSFFFTRSTFAKDHPDIVKTFIKYTEKAGKEIDNNPSNAAKLLEKETNIPKQTWEKVLKKGKSTIQYMDKKTIQDLQVQSDDLLKIGLTNKTVKIQDFVWYPKN
jgi:sulfonate transport system substrate-binding protein